MTFFWLLLIKYNEEGESEQIDFTENRIHMHEGLSLNSYKCLMAFQYIKSRIKKELHVYPSEIWKQEVVHLQKDNVTIE